MTAPSVGNTAMSQFLGNILIMNVRDEYPEFTMAVKDSQRPCDIMSFDYDTIGEDLHDGQSIRVATQWGPMVAPSMQAINEFRDGYDDALVHARITGKQLFIDVSVWFHDVVERNSGSVREIPLHVQLECEFQGTKFFDITLVRTWHSPMNPPLPAAFNEYLQEEQARIRPGWKIEDLLLGA